MKLSKKALRALAENSLIGLETEIVRSTDPSLQGIKGKVVDETMKTLEIRTERGCMKIDKKSASLAFHFPNGVVEIPGRAILQRPEERLKKLWTKVK